MLCVQLNLNILLYLRVLSKKCDSGFRSKISVTCNENTVTYLYLFNDQGNDCNVLKSVTYVSWRQKKPICQSCQKKTVFLVTCFTLDYGVLQSVSIVLYLKMNTMFQLSLKPLKTSEDETSKNETSASLRSSSSLLALAVPSSPRTCLRTLNFPQTLVAPTMVHCKTTSAIPNISQIQQKVLQN